ncbi:MULTISPECIES: heme lyase CcmF/NrfE family subunit [unclassified Brevundimonas]|uniref:heme lyase CcmF/NrfE family subunit n=1 Tax=unclassified Brevundimonas TaxID=2622653 RepID=UPI0025C52021|nr:MULTISPECIES: heme lyase CcmF/NrfE family subunit [unclassified Brevundimonas]
MIVELGSYSLILSLALSVFGGVMATWARVQRRPVIAGAASAAMLAASLAIIVAFGCLIWAYVTSDFSVANVAANSHTDKPLFYKIAGAWGNHEGSLLLWCLVMTAFGAVLGLSRGLPFGLKTSAVAVQASLSTMFLAFAAFTSNPFNRLAEIPVQGRSLNPLLQDPALAIHPPLLYAGYVGFSVCFSLAVAALIEKRVDPAWGRWVRPWALASWALLTVGIGLGSFWAYYELGWGGWWFWDPVENASFLPWLAGAALLHSAVVTERRGALAGWTVFLSILAFSFSMLGAFLVRSGVLTSVHAFAVDPERGMMLLGILGLSAGAAFALFALRAPSIRSMATFAPVSREGILVLNNLFLTTAAVTVLLGTLYPLFLEAMTGATISVGPPYFNAVFAPLMGIACLLLPAGPLMGWKRGDLVGAVQRLRFAALLAVVGALLAFFLFDPKKALVAAGVGLGLWLIFGAVFEVAERTKALRAPLAETLRRARNLPLGAWGMALAHAGVGVFILGAVVETGFKVETARVIPIQGEVAAGPWKVRLDDVAIIEGPNYLAEQGKLTVSAVNEKARETTVTSERRFFPAGGQTTTEVGLDFRGLDDVYVVIGERARTEDGEPAWLVRLYYNPWARLIFLGPALMALGGLVSLLDRRLRVGAGPGTRRRREGKA